MDWIPTAEYYAGLPKNIASGGALLHDPLGRFLLVEPSYRTDGTWDIPGGTMEPGEYPWETTRREVREEISIDLPTGALLAVDWVPALPDGRPPLVNFVFDGGPITEDEAGRRIFLADGELLAWRLAGPDEWDDLLLPRMARRVRACARALETGVPAYLQHGYEL